MPVCKRLWRQIVRAKIKAQAALLVELRGTDFGLGALVLRVRSGDPSNVEARAARRYWPHVFADLDFRRHRENEDQNILLNYGYAVLRAIIARAICAAGLHPSLGIHHHNRYNAFCLADDLMEPFRPAVDHAVAEYMAHARRAVWAGTRGQAANHRRPDRPLLDGRRPADHFRRGRPHGGFAWPTFSWATPRSWRCRSSIAFRGSDPFSPRSLGEGPGVRAICSPRPKSGRGARVRACREKNSFCRGTVECGSSQCSTCR